MAGNTPDTNREVVDVRVNNFEITSRVESLMESARTRASQALLAFGLGVSITSSATAQDAGKSNELLTGNLEDAEVVMMPNSDINGLAPSIMPKGNTDTSSKGLFNPLTLGNEVIVLADAETASKSVMSPLDNLGVTSRSGQEGMEVAMPSPELTGQDQLLSYLSEYMDPEAADDFAFYIDDMQSFEYSNLRIDDANAVLAMFEADGVLSEDAIKNGDAELVVLSVLSWFGTEATSGGAGEMHFSIEELYSISPSTTSRALAYAASAYGDVVGNENHTPWDIAVTQSYERGISYNPKERVLSGSTSSEIIIASN